MVVVVVDVNLTRYPYGSIMCPYGLVKCSFYLVKSEQKFGLILDIFLPFLTDFCCRTTIVLTLQNFLCVCVGVRYEPGLCYKRFSSYWNLADLAIFWAKKSHFRHFHVADCCRIFLSSLLLPKKYFKRKKLFLAICSRSGGILIGLVQSNNAWIMPNLEQIARFCFFAFSGTSRHIVQRVKIRHKSANRKCVNLGVFAKPLWSHDKPSSVRCNHFQRL